MLESKLTENKQLTTNYQITIELLKNYSLGLNETKNELEVNKMKQQQTITIRQRKRKSFKKKFKRCNYLTIFIEN